MKCTLNVAALSLAALFSVALVSSMCVAQSPPPTFNVQVTNFPDTHTVDGTVSVDNFPDVQTVDGTVNIGNLPDVQTEVGFILSCRDTDDFPSQYSGCGVDLSSVQALGQVILDTVDIRSHATDSVTPLPWTDWDLLNVDEYGFTTVHSSAFETDRVYQVSLGVRRMSSDQPHILLPPEANWFRAAVGEPFSLAEVHVTGRVLLDPSAASAVASLPEPSSATLLTGLALLLPFRRRLQGCA